MHAGFVPCPTGAFEPYAGIATPGPVVLPGLNNRAIGGGTRAPGDQSSAAPLVPARPARAALARLLMVAALAVPFLAAAPGAAAPVRRNGNVYNFKAHQPTQAGVTGRERRAGVTAPSAQVRRNARTVRHLDQHLLNEEAAPLPRDPVSLTPP